MANLPKKTSNRTVGVAPKASASGRAPAVNTSTSNRMKPSVKTKAAPPPEPEPPEPEVEEVVEEVAEEVQEAPPQEDSESLLGELSEVVHAVPKRGDGMPLSADEHLLSDDSLYGDDDPLEKAGKKQPLVRSPIAKPSARAPVPVSNKKIKPESAAPAKTEAEPEPAEDAEKSKSNVSKKSIKPGRPDSRIMKPAAKSKDDEPAEKADAIDDDAELIAEPKSSKRLSAKSNSRVMKGASRRMEKVEEKDEDDEEDNSRVSRRTTKRSIRGKPVGFKLTKLQKIGAIVGAVVILVVVAGYSPFMVSMYKKGLTGPDGTVDSRKSAAKSLVDFDPNQAYPVCSAALTDTNADIREAAIYGMGLLGHARNMRGMAISSFSTTVSSAEPATKVLILKALSEIAQDTSKAVEANKDDKDSVSDLSTMATAIMPRAEAATEPAAEVRAAAVEGLGKLRVPGVCKVLIKIATSGDADLKSKARDGIAYTALPDSAGALLEAVGGSDASLAAVCKQAFVQVRDSAKSEVLAGLVGDPSDDVRREVVAALAKRSNDAAACTGLIRAFKDKLPEIRAAAVKGIPTTGMSGSVMSLAELITDTDENVRVETGNTLGELRDPDSAKMVLEAFKNPMSGKTMSAFVTALGKRTSGKDLKACAIVMGILERNPSAEASVKEAMALLTQSTYGGARVNARRAWDIEKWKAWWTNISQREKMRKDAAEKLEALRKHKDDDHSTFPGLMRQVEAQLDILEKCTEMCKPDDPEDIPLLEDQQHQSTFLKEHFMKNASINGRGE